MAAGALPLVRGCGGGGLRRRRVALRAGGLFAGDLCTGGEVGPLAGHGQSLPRMTGQNVRVHVPTASSVGGALFVDGAFLYETPDLDPVQKVQKMSRYNILTSNQIHLPLSHKENATCFTAMKK